MAPKLRRDAQKKDESRASPKDHIDAETDLSQDKIRATLSAVGDSGSSSIPKKLTSQPGWMDQVSKGVTDINEETRKRGKQPRYDPYSFLDKMAMPFDLPIPPPPPPNGKGKKGESTEPRKPMPHCKACTDFKTWMELTAHPRRDMSREEREAKECPLDSELLGRNTWAFLHTMAAYFPEKPSPEQQYNMKKFINLLSQFYPCHKCASHLREELKTNVPDTTNNVNLSQWFCNLHNRVNVRLGKPEFDCSKVFERWRDGWADGTCD